MPPKKEPAVKLEPKTIDVILDREGPVGAMVRQATRQIQLNEKPFKVNVSTTGRAYYGATKNPGWVINGMPRPQTKQGLNQLTPQMRPLGSLIIYPSIDPYTPIDRALFKALMIAGSWIQRANVIIQKLVVAKFSTEVEPRAEQELTEEKLKEWQQAEINIPLWGKKKTPEYVKEWMVNLVYITGGIPAVADFAPLGVNPHTTLGLHVAALQAHADGNEELALFITKVWAYGIFLEEDFEHRLKIVSEYLDRIDWCEDDGQEEYLSFLKYALIEKKLDVPQQAVSRLLMKHAGAPGLDEDVVEVLTTMAEQLSS